MSGFVDTMRLKEMAEEDIYFARRDRELVEALRRKKAEQQARGEDPGAPRTPAAPLKTQG